MIFSSKVTFDNEDDIYKQLLHLLCQEIEQKVEQRQSFKEDTVLGGWLQKLSLSQQIFHETRNKWAIIENTGILCQKCHVYLAQKFRLKYRRGKSPKYAPFRTLCFRCDSKKVK
jgi:hypothetical protein